MMMLSKFLSSRIGGVLVVTMFLAGWLGPTRAWAEATQVGVWTTNNGNGHQFIYKKLQRQEPVRPHHRLHNQRAIGNRRRPAWHIASLPTRYAPQRRGW